MVEGHHPVLTALPDRHRPVDLVERETPVVQHRQVVVQPSPDAPADGQLDGVGQVLRKLARHRRDVDGRDQVPERLVKLLGGDPGVTSRHVIEEPDQLPRVGGRKLLDVLVAHAREPVQALSVARRDRRERRGRDHPVAQQCRASQRVWAAARPADGVEAADPELIGDRLDVGGAISDGAARPAVAAGVPGSRVGDMAQPTGGAGRDHRLEHDPGAGRAGVEEHDGIARRPGRSAQSRSCGPRSRGSPALVH